MALLGFILTVFGVLFLVGLIAVSHIVGIVILVIGLVLLAVVLFGPRTTAGGRRWWV